MCNFKSRSEQIEIKKKKQLVFLLILAFNLYEKCRRLQIFILLKSRNKIKIEEGLKFFCFFFHRAGVQVTTIIVIQIYGILVYGKVSPAGRWAYFLSENHL